MYKSYIKNPDHFDSPKSSKLISVALYGSQNSGKSTLMNTLVNKYVSAVSDKRFTTFEPIIGIKTIEDLKT